MPAARKPRKRVDPYREYNFRVKWDGRIVAGITKVSALKRTTDVVEYRDGNSGATLKLPGVIGFDPITLERGITRDTAFEAWARLVAGVTGAPLAFRKEVRLEVYNAHGRLALAYDVHRCWPSEYVALGPLEAGSESGLIQSLTLQNEGWERDPSIKPPKKSRKSKPSRCARAPSSALARKPHDRHARNQGQ
jgi:phage tail-like protein